MKKFFVQHWERIFFGLVGLVFLGFSMHNLYTGMITEASATFAMSFMSFIYANLARFKRFKGLGFEAELWGDKQEEAAELISRLKNVVAISTRETVLGKVMQGRWGGSSSDWKDRWALYDELITRQNSFWEEIDFSDLKRKMDRIFIFDICSELAASIRKTVTTGKAKASKEVDLEFGTPIKDSVGYSKRRAPLQDISEGLKDSFILAQEGDLAGELLDLAENAKRDLKLFFGIEIEFDEKVTANLKMLSELQKRGPIYVTQALLDLANERR